MQTPSRRVHHAHRKLDKGNTDPKEPMTTPEMLSQHQKRVPQLEVGDPFDARAHAGIPHHRPADEATAPAGGIGPEGEFAFLKNELRTMNDTIRKMDAGILNTQKDIKAVLMQSAKVE